MEEIQSRVLAVGEATGHCHRLLHSEVFEDTNGLKHFSVEASDQVVHEEHGVIDLGCGDYIVGRVREYDHFTEEARKIED